MYICVFTRHNSYQIWCKNTIKTLTFARFCDSIAKLFCPLLGSWHPHLTWLIMRNQGVMCRRQKFLVDWCFLIHGRLAYCRTNPDSTHDPTKHSDLIVFVSLQFFALLLRTASPHGPGTMIEPIGRPIRSRLQKLPLFLDTVDMEIQRCPRLSKSISVCRSVYSKSNMNMKYRSQTLEFCGNLVISCDLVLRLVMPVFQKKHHTVDALFAALRHALGTSKCAYEKLLKQLTSSQR